MIFFLVQMEINSQICFSTIENFTNWVNWSSPIFGQTWQAATLQKKFITWFCLTRLKSKKELLFKQFIYFKQLVIYKVLNGFLSMPSRRFKFVYATQLDSKVKALIALRGFFFFFCYFNLFNVIFIVNLSDN